MAQSDDEIKRDRIMDRFEVIVILFVMLMILGILSLVILGLKYLLL